jgi:hypothetical protein
MPNVNITKTTTDTQDNVRYTQPIQKIDFRGITLLVISVFGTITAVWMIALGFANIGCYIVNENPCTEASYIFWGYLVLLFITVIVALFMALPAIIEARNNMRYLRWRGIITSRENLDKFAADVISVALQSARSEATAGMDNYAPSISKTQTTQEPAIKEASHVPVTFFDLDEE